MAANNIHSLYSLTYTDLPPGFKPPEDPKAVRFSEKSLRGEAPHFIIIEFLEHFAKDFIFDHGNRLEKGVRATLTFSAKEGLVVHSDSDEKFTQFLQEKYRGLAMLILEGSQAQEIDPSTIKMASISEEEKERVFLQHPGKKNHIVDPFAYHLWSHKILNPVTVELQVNRRQPLSLAGGLTTGHFRYPQLLKDLVTRYDSERQSEETQVCILGPGLLEQKKTSPSCPQIYPSCPQFVELLSLFPQAHFSLLDNHPDALGTLKKYCSTCKLMSYDPFTFRVFTDSFNPTNTLRAPEHYQPLFEQIKAGLTGLALKPPSEKAREILEGYGHIEPLLVKVDPNKVHIQEFDILSSSMEEMGPFDIIVATHSITNAFEIEREQNSACNPLPQLLKILQSLKEGGSLYIDKPGMDHLLFIIAKQLNFTVDDLIGQIESHLGNKIKLTELPLSDYQQESVGHIGTMPNFLISTADQEGMSTIGTASITVLTRTHEKIALATE
ncbi:MAG: hypothetical protein ACHQUC_05115 [Chlamydiales bacterium]